MVHAAAWSDVDGCALDPALAMRRNGEATGVLAAACAGRGVDLLAISTNEVFDGRRLDGSGYDPSDPPAPGNPYGASKLEGERRAQAAFDGRPRGQPRDRPDRLAVRDTGAGLSQSDPPRLPTGPPRSERRSGW